MQWIDCFSADYFVDGDRSFLCVDYPVRTDLGFPWADAAPGYLFVDGFLGDDCSFFADHGIVGSPRLFFDDVVLVHTL